MAIALGIAGALVVLPIACIVGVALLSRGTAARIRQRQVASPLAHELPWWQLLDDGTIIGTDLTYSAGLALEGVDSDCLDDADLEQIQRALHGTLQPLPAGTRLQWIHVTDHDHSAMLDAYHRQVVSRTGCAELLANQKLQALRDAQGLRRSRLYLFASLPRPSQGPLPRFGMPRRFQSVTALQHDENCRRLQNLVRQLASGLTGAELAATPLSGEATRALIYELLNPTRILTLAAPSRSSTLPFADEQTAREQLSFANLREDVDTFELDGRRMRVVTLRDLPTMTDPALLEGLTVTLPFPCRVQLALEICDDQKALDQLKRKRDQANAHAQLGKRRNQEAEAAAADLEQLIDKNIDASIRMVRIALSVVLSVDSRSPDADAQLEHQTAEVLRALAGLHGAQGMVETYAQLDSFLATLPANAHHRMRSHTCTSINAAHLLLAWQSWPGHPAPPILVENGRKYLLGLDPFADELDNPNAFMAGASGSGKSVTTNYVLMHLFAAGVKGLIIDVGGSYRKLLSLYGGAYFTFDEAADAALNLFYDPADALLPDGRLDPLRRRFMLAVLETLLVDHERPKLGHEEIAVLDTALSCLYQDHAEAPILSDLLAFLRAASWPEAEDYEIARRLARRLQRWTRGVHARLLDRPSTVKLTTDFAGFDLKGLSHEVRAPVVLILSAIIWNLVMRDPGEKKIVVFDEVWTLLGNPAAAELLEELYRTSRKYRCAILSISQSVDDFTGSSIAQALVNNSATTYLLRHRAGHEIIADTFHLNNRERYVFKALEMRRGEFSELLVIAGRHHFLARVVLTPFEYWIATTHPADQALLGRLIHDFPHASLFDVLRHASLLHPGGVTDLPPAESPA